MTLSRFFLTLGLLAVAPWASAADKVDPNSDRVVGYLSSPDELIADTHHIVVDLAGEEKAWANSVFPNIEVWLFGVDRARSVGLDFMFTPDKGKQLEFHVPVSKRKAFLNDNLGNVNILAKQDKSNPNLYKLTDVYEGWLLFTKMATGEEYGSIAPNQAALPKNNEAPTGKLEVFKKAHHDAGIRWVATAETKAERDKGFAKMLSEVNENIKKRPDETAPEFELRKLAAEQTITRVTRMLSGASELMAGWNTDVKAKKYGGSSRLVGLPGSDVEKNINRIGTETSKFAKVATEENAAMSARVLLPLADIYQQDQKKLYAASLASVKDRIDRKTDISADEKTARKKFAELLNQMATDSVSLGWLDIYAELMNAPGKLYTGLVAFRVTDSSIVASMLEQIPKAQAGWNVKLNVAEEGTTKIHLVDMKGKLPTTLKTYFGDSAEAYIGLGEQTVWMATGPESLAKLKAAIQASQSGSRAADQNKAVLLTMHVEPALRIGKSLVEDRDIELFHQFKESGGILKNRGDNSDAKKPGKDDSERRVSKNALQNFKWQETALTALEGGKDKVELEVTKDGTALLGEMKIEEGMMRAVGKVIAKFALEVLQ